ncbi:hypothetical protein CLV76_107179 [Marivita geojedonensis]|nr:hypothetical protein CLV76_107179 [Marivita geojedonensis]
MTATCFDQKSLNKSLAKKEPPTIDCVNQNKSYKSPGSIEKAYRRKSLGYDLFHLFGFRHDVLAAEMVVARVGGSPQ